MKHTIEHVDRLEGILKVPGDKSISHRALILGATARGKHVVEGISTSLDVETTARCLRDLGCFIEEMPDGRTLVLAHGVDAQAEGTEGVGLDAGNSGTTARLLCGLVAGLGVRCRIDGDDSLRRRPMQRVVEPLSLMGASISTTMAGTLPIDLSGGNLTGITYELPVASAQVKSAILIAGLFAKGDTTVVEPVPTRDHTERMLAAMGAEVRREGNAVTVSGGQRLEGARIAVPGDFSSAAYFIVAASLIPGSDLYLPSTGVNPTRTGLLSVLESMGAAVSVENETEVSGEPSADVAARAAGALRGVTIDDPALVASIIDEIPVVAVAATQAEGKTSIRGAGELRHKESDRIQAIADNLRRMGADVVDHEDGLTVTGPTRLRGAAVSSFGDHRIAMAMAVAGMLADGETEIDDASIVDISFPGFFNNLLAVSRREGD
jgi:3-phosphoshikimate 1-carboxyvinyltransferase